MRSNNVHANKTGQIHICDSAEKVVGVSYLLRQVDLVVLPRKGEVVALPVLYPHALPGIAHMCRSQFQLTKIFDFVDSRDGKANSDTIGLFN